MMEFDDLSNRIIGCAIEVHRQLGAGLLELAYEKALGFELSTSGLRFRPQAALPIIYKGIDLGFTYRMDFIVEDSIVIELKSVEKLLPIHEAQLLTYMKFSKVPIGLLLNFNTKYLKDGMKRLVL